MQYVIILPYKNKKEKSGFFLVVCIKHKQDLPPLCKGRGTAEGGGGIVKVAMKPRRLSTATIPQSKPAVLPAPFAQGGLLRGVDGAVPYDVGFGLRE